MSAPLETIELTAKQKKARKARSLALALCLVVFVVLVYAVTVLKFGPALMERSI
ncbi:MAG: hypothetical protein WA921_08920 [Ahrensia sp.]